MYLFHFFLQLFLFLYCEIMHPKIGWFDAGMSKPADAIPYGESVYHVYACTSDQFTPLLQISCMTESFKPLHPWGFVTG